MAHENGKSVKATVLQFIKFNLVGVVNSLIDFGIYWLLNRFLGWTYVAQVISYSCGMANSYLMNSSWTFKESRTRSFREIAGFVLVNLVSLLVSLGGIWLFSTVFGLTNVWAEAVMPRWLYGVINGDMLCKIFATMLSVIVNYLGNRLFVFKKKPRPAAKGEGENSHAGQS